MAKRFALRNVIGGIATARTRQVLRAAWRSGGVGKTTALNRLSHVML